MVLRSDASLARQARPGGSPRLSGLPDRLAGLRLPEGMPLLIIHGSAPFVTDLYVGRDLQVRELDRTLWSWLRAQGFRRIVVNRRGRPAYVLDQESARLLQPRPVLTEAAVEPRPRQMTRFVGVMGKAILPAAHDMTQSVGSSPSAPGMPGSPAARVTPGSLDPPGAPGGASPSPPVPGPSSALTDQGAVDLLDAAMLDQSARTAVIFAEAEQWLVHNKAQSAFADALSRWSESSGGPGNVCILVFRRETLGEIQQFLAVRPGYPALEAILADLNSSAGSARPGAFAIGPPSASELAGLLHRHRLIRGLALADWRELPAIIRAMAAARMPVRAWQHRLGSVPESGALSLASMRDRGWMPEGGSSSLTAMERLHRLVGLPEVKEHIERVAAYMRMQAKLAAAGRVKEPPAGRLNMVFTGNPGTGKTTVAELLGEIYRDLGVLAVGHVHTAKPSEMIAGYVGHTRMAIEAAVAKARGGILFLDEAYQLTDEKSGFGSEAISTLVHLMDRERDQLAVVVAGYQDKMNEFLTANPGLPRRFPEHNRIHFPDYRPDELMTILLAAMDKNGLSWTAELESQLRRIVTAMYEQRSNQFGNAGEMENLADELQHLWSTRATSHLEPVGVECIPPRFRAFLAPAKVARVDEILAELNGYIGLATVKDVITGLAESLAVAAKRRTMGLGGGPVTAPNMLFVGPPGTGKTSVARLVGRMFHAMELLRSGHLVEATSADLIGEHVGQTAPQTRAKVLEALDGVLFIDEAYGVTGNTGSSSFGGEAITELVKQMSDHEDHLVVIAAGYPQRMREFLQANPGLSSRFTEQVKFEGYSDDELVQILRLLAAKEDYELPDPVARRAALWLAANRVATGESFGNARTVERILWATMKRRLSQRVVRSPNPSIDMFRIFEPTDVPDAGS